MDRRDFMQTTAALAGLTLAGGAITACAQESMDKDSEAYWQTIINQYKVTDEFINLNSNKKIENRV